MSARHAHTRPPVRGLAVLAAAFALVVLQAAPSSARPLASKWSGSCASDPPYYTPRGRAYMIEYGKSGVTRLKAQFRLYRTNVTAGYNSPYLRKTYTSPSFPNDAVSYGQWLPYTSNHQWEYVAATSDYALTAKMTWERPWRRDWNYQQVLAYCR
jgi:hypothetical protein